MLRAKTARIASLTWVLSISSLVASAQIASSDHISPGVPRVLRFKGLLKDSSGQALNGTVNVSFAIYKDPAGGTPLWEETQTAIFSDGQYSVLLGSGSQTGIPSDLFSSGESRWLGVRPLLDNEDEERPRIFLASVPYALKASDADTLGGLPVSAFVMNPTFMPQGSADPTALASVQAASVSSDGSSGTLVLNPSIQKNVQSKSRRESTHLFNLSATKINGYIYVDGETFARTGEGIEAAVNALPSCTISPSTWKHCGTVILSPGTYTVSSTISLTSPFVVIQGSTPGAVKINWTGTTGAVFDWTAIPFNAGNNTESGGLFGVLIDGSGGSAGTSGIHFYDVVGLHIQHVQVNGFLGTDSAGIWQDAIAKWTERSDVEATIYNCKTDFRQTSHAGGNTLGYGIFDLRLNIAAGQTGISTIGLAAPADFSQNLLHIIINGDNGTESGIVLSNANWYSNSGMIHVEGMTTGVNLSVNSMFIQPKVAFDSGNANNTFTGAALLTNTSASSVYPWQVLPFASGSNNNLIIGNTADSGGHYAINLAAPIGNPVSAIGYGVGGVEKFRVDANGNVVTAGIVNTSAGVEIGGAAPYHHFLCGNGTNYVDSADCGTPDTAITVGTSQINGHSCTMTTSVQVIGVTTRMTFNFTPTVDVTSVTGWGSSGGLIISAWPTVNTLNYKVCNQTASPITPSSSVTFNVSAK